VVTLVPSEDCESIVLGCAYEIEYENIETTFQYLDYREKCGYSKNEVDFYPLSLGSNSNESFKSFCYYANEASEYFSSGLNEKQIAQVKNNLFCSTPGSKWEFCIFVAYQPFERTKWNKPGLFSKTMWIYSAHNRI
jgi:hypothetical protein